MIITERAQLAAVLRKRAPELLALNDEQIRDVLKGLLCRWDSFCLYKSPDDKYEVLVKRETEYIGQAYIPGISGGSLESDRYLFLSIEKKDLIQGGYGLSYHPVAGMRFADCGEIVAFLLEAKRE